MHILPVQSHNQQNPNFNGKVMTKGVWTNYLERSFLNNEAVKGFAESGYDIIGKMKYRKSSGYSMVHNKGDKLYKLSISARKENPSTWGKIKTFLGLDKTIKITKGFHRERSMENIMDIRITNSRLERLKQ